MAQLQVSWRICARACHSSLNLVVSYLLDALVFISWASLYLNWEDIEESEGSEVSDEPEEPEVSEVSEGSKEPEEVMEIERQEAQVERYG